MTHWIAFKGYNNNKAIALSQVDYGLVLTFGAHAYDTKAQAEAHPNSVSVWDKLEVNAVIDDYNNSRDVGGPTQANNPSNPVPAVASGAKIAAKGAEKAAAAVIKESVKISGLNASNILVRGVKITTGVLLIGIGLVKLTGADQKLGGNTGKLLKTAVKTAPLL